MTVSERKVRLIRQILDTDDLEFERLERFFKEMGIGRLPGQETVEEMRDGVLRATSDYYEGKNTISQEKLETTFKF